MWQTERVQMARRPGSTFSVDDFRCESVAVAPPKPDEVVTKTAFISLDPYLAGMMKHWQGPEPDWQQGIIVGRMVGQVLASGSDLFAEGDWVSGACRWQGIECQRAGALQKISPEQAIPPQSYLGVLGTSGMTAWVGIHRILDVQNGETFCVSSAAGMVGNIAGQMAKQRGATVIGIAGGAEKCREVVAHSGFDACIDHRAQNFAGQLAAAAARGIDAHFENVGSKTLDPVLAVMNDFGRIALCGLIAHYLDDQPIALSNFRRLLTSALSLRGFRIYDYFDDSAQAMAELRAMLKSGQLTVRETITRGLGNAPQAYIDMLEGRGVGKHLVQMD